MKNLSIKAGLKTARTEKRRRTTGLTGRMCSLLLASLLVLLSAVFMLPASAYADTPVISSSLPAAQLGTYYYAALTATGGTPPYSWALVGGSLPPWLNLAADSGVISGTPASQGTFSFQVKVTDSASASAQGTLFITVSAPPLVFSTTSLPSAKENTPYSAAFSVSGGTAPYTMSIVGGSLPQGLILDPVTGTISGTPARGTAGYSTFSVRISDSSATAVSTQRSFTLMVDKGSYQSNITIGTGLKTGAATVSINGAQVSQLQGGQSIQRSFDLGASQSVSVDPVIQDPSRDNVRYKAENASQMISEYSPDALFNYVTEYYVTVSSQPSGIEQISGSGWYREGAALRATAPDTMQNGTDADTQYRFSYWSAPDGAHISGAGLNLGVTSPGVYTANYDTYYRLSFTSPMGEQKDSVWYKAGTQANWNLSVAKLPMSGILGFFRGTWNALNSSGTVLMDRPQHVTVSWEPDYTMPLILIPGALLLVGLCIYGLYALARRPAGMPIPYYPAAQAPAPTQPFIPQYTPPPAPVYFIPPPVYSIPPPARPALPPAETAVMRPQPVTIKITDGDRQEAHNAARQKILDEFGKLLDNYAREIAASRQEQKNPELNASTEVQSPALTEKHKLN